MPKNRKLKATWVDVQGTSVQCETLEDLRQGADGYWYKIVRISGDRVKVRSKHHRGTFERYSDV